MILQGKNGRAALAKVHFIFISDDRSASQEKINVEQVRN